MRTRSTFLIAAVLGLYAGAAAAYVGPGAGIGMLGALWGLIVGVVMAIGVILFWPIRMMMRRAKARKETGQDMQGNTNNPGAAERAQSADADQATAETSQPS